MSDIRTITSKREDEIVYSCKELAVPYELVKYVH